MVGFITRPATLMAISANVSSTNPRPGFFWWVLVQMSNVPDMVGIKLNFETKGGLSLVLTVDLKIRH